MWIGIDDTDSPRGGCTTWVLTELLALARDRDIDLIGLPRLVRLNPNVPWKTRGNAALSARFGRGTGPRTVVGEIDGRIIWSYCHGRELSVPEAAEWESAAWDVVRRSSQQGVPGTDPAMVTAPRRPPARLYWRTVREIVPIAEARHAVRDVDGTIRTLGSPRGLVGAAASLAWPGRRATFEAISYRVPERVGQPRTVDADSVRRAQRTYPDLFLCWDDRTRRLLVAPHTPCPILYGLRSRTSEAAKRARRLVRSEPVDRWVLFRTNQGTGDHLRGVDIGSLTPLTSGRLRGRVSAPARTRPGGHVTFPFVDASGRVIECVVFEPTKTLPRVARVLDVGDRIAVWGSRGIEPTLRIEGIEVLRWSAARGARLPPRCTRCSRAAHSMGRARGYRCRSCGARWPPESGRRAGRPPPFPLGVYHPTPSARRHLAPLGPESPGDALPF